MTTPCCPCDAVVFPPEPQIPAGLATLPRQVLGFPEYRRAMLDGVLGFPPLAAWRARAGDDLGLLLLESWAVVLDVLGFYDARIAQDLYLGTAQDPAALRRLVALIGYRPRPAMAAEAWIAALIDRGPDVLMPAGTAFRSEAFGSEAPQVFESDTDALFNAHTNRWVLAPVRPATAAGGDRLRFDPRTLRLVRGAWAVFAGAIAPAVVRVTDIVAAKAVDGVLYAEAAVAPVLALPAGTELAAVTVRLPTLSARLNRLTSTPVSGAVVQLDGVYPQLQPGDDVVLAVDDAAMLARVSLARPVLVTPPATSGLAAVPATQLTLASPLVAPWSTSTSLVVHFGLVDGGTLRRPASTAVQRGDLNPVAALAGPSAPLASPAAGPVLLRDAELAGVDLAATVEVDADGSGTLHPAADSTPFARPLVPPIEAFGNRLHVVRGETVGHEVLGSGNAALAWPAFKLKRKPLTYVPNAATGGRRSTLVVRVDGLAWTEVDSFYGSVDGDRVFIVRLDDAQVATITFRRLPSGVDNVVASYRFGGGAAKPPPGGLSQVVRPVKGLARVIDPVGASGGADADGPDDIRASAAASALTLGRAVSIDDFVALARGFPGIVNVSARWSWDPTQQRAVVKLWFVADGGDPSAALRSFLRGQADPDVPLAAGAAHPEPHRLVVDFIAADGHVHADVEARLIALLGDAKSGLLAPARVPIGGPIFRSALYAALAGVDGLRAVRRLAVDGVDMPAALVAGDGCYLAFLPFTNS